MVSLWPWKGEDNSPASFEKALSSLATKISKSQQQLDSLRQRGRRLKALWTLYTSFAYILCLVVLFLVVGWKNLTAVEYTAVAGSPLFIYLIRTFITAYYNFRVDTVTQRLEDQQSERTKTIDKLKAATKYNSTQELLEKYGGAALKPSPKVKKPPGTPQSPRNSQKEQQRTGMGPPPTANVPRPNQGQSQPSTPQPLLNRTPPPQILPRPLPQQAGPPEFAPNAFSSASQYAAGGDLNGGGHWYDRVLDLLLGEDETLPKNRMVLICQNCRLVNGQAPPGTKSISDLGKWKCFGCGGWNGEEDEAVKVVQEMKERIETKSESRPLAGLETTGTEGSGPEVRSGAQDGGDELDAADDEEESGSGEEIIEVKAKSARPKSTRKKA